MLKSLEIYYDVATMPGVAPGDMQAALGFRNAAMDHIELALGPAGEWEGAEIGTDPATGQIAANFGFTVEDFDAAEAIIRRAVAGTPYAVIREIRRAEIDPRHV